MNQKTSDYKPYRGKRRMYAIDYVCIFLGFCIIVSCAYWAVWKTVSLSKEMSDMQSSGSVYVVKNGEVVEVVNRMHSP